jgi:hypothetical protein
MCVHNENTRSVSSLLHFIEIYIHLVFLSEFLGESSAHDLAADAGGSLEMSPAALAAGRANVYDGKKNN